jgi:hypothetical protein
MKPVGYPRGNRQVAARLKARNPLVNRLPTEVQAVGDVLHAFSLIQPQQCLGAPQTVPIAPLMKHFF